MMQDLVIVLRWLAQTKTPPAHVAEAMDRLHGMVNPESRTVNLSADNLTTAAPKHTGL